MMSRETGSASMQQDVARKTILLKKPKWRAEL